MALRTTTYPTRQNFFVDPGSIVRGSGRQVDWDLVSDLFRAGSFNVVVGAGGANPGATSIPVAALQGNIPAGKVLNFGEANFVVTLSAAALAAATSITVVALPGPVQAGTLLDFGSNKFARASADAAAGATSIAVDAIPTALAGTETATVSGQKYAQLTDAADAGDTAITVEALAQGLDAADVAISDTGALGSDKYIPPGTVVCEIAATGKIVPRSSRPGAETATGIIETGANENSTSDSLSGYSVIGGGNLYENLLPDADPGTGLLPAAYKTEMQTAGVGTGFAFEQYSDSRAS